MTIARSNCIRRAALLASATSFCLLAGIAQAQDLGRPDLNDVVRESQDDGPGAPTPAFREPQDGGFVQPGGPDLVPQIVIANPGTPTTDRDPVNVTGVGQMIVDEQNGFIGLCTGTLINPRTVIFAAHCVNSQAANTYGQDSGGQPIGFGFSNSNNTAGASAFGAWLNGSATYTNGVKYATTPSLYMYDANYVAYNPLSTQANAAGFLYGDIALASLDTPAANVPTWALLFSQLPARFLNDANGTAYHVTIEGYGNNGTATTGSTGGIDYRRRVAENTLGALASLGDFEQFLFGPGGTSNTTNPQNLYWIDFDDPKRGQPGASPYDFNAWRDNALPNEGTTASGDSGGPLILDREFAKSVVLGVLSGGYTRFFNGAPANGYGTASFYQPLYLYWDWIAANNPYHYVSAVAGNGNWTDPTHWVTNLDPSYQIIQNGQLVNGVPTATGAGNTDQPGFGQACFQTTTVSDCYDVASGTETVSNQPIGSAANDPATVAAGTIADDKGQVAASTLSGGGLTDETVSKTADTGQAVAQSATPQAVLPAATLTNGLPGATNFVPSNDDGNRLTSTAPKYFDVTLSAAGTTTLNSAVTIDRFTLAGTNAMLDIQSGGSLTSLMSITQGIGTMQVNGTLTTPGDYMMLLGGLNGTGTINANYFTSIAGTISPGSTGAAGTIGTLTFNSNLILASGTTYLADLGNSGASDKIAVTAAGQANLGGRVLFNWNSNLRAGNTFTILTAAGGITPGSTFQSPAPITAILAPKFIYTTNAVQVQIVASNYSAIIDPNSTVQLQYAILLDRNRSLASKYDALYGPLDLQNAATIRATLEALAPTTETTLDSIATASVDSTAGFFRDRLAGMHPDNMGGTFARYGQPTQVAALNFNGMGGISAMGYDGRGVVRSDSSQPMVQAGKLPDDMAAFVAGGYINGDSAAMNHSLASMGRDTFNGWYVSGGLETQVDEDGALGFALSYTRVDGTGALAGQSARTTAYQGTLYGKLESKGVTLDAQVSAGVLDGTTRRSISFVGTPYTLSSSDHALIVNTEVGLAKDFDLGMVALTPRAAFRGTHIGLTPTAETGGPMALQYDRLALDSAQGRGSLTLAGTGKVRPWVTGTYVHDFVTRQGGVSAQFVGGVGLNSVFPLNTEDQDWFEASGGLTFHTKSIDFSASAETTIERNDLSNQTYRGSMTIRF